MCAVLFFGVLALVATAGCSSKPPQVSLSNGQVDIHGTDSFKASVQYKFTQGKPRGGNLYRLVVVFHWRTNIGHIQSFTLLQADGSEFPAEGTAEKDFKIERRHQLLPNGVPITYEFAITERTDPNSTLHNYLKEKLEGTASVPK